MSAAARQRARPCESRVAYPTITGRSPAKSKRALTGPPSLCTNRPVAKRYNRRRSRTDRTAFGTRTLLGRAADRRRHVAEQQRSPAPQRASTAHVAFTHWPAVARCKNRSAPPQSASAACSLPGKSTLSKLFAVGSGFECLCSPRRAKPIGRALPRGRASVLNLR